MAWSTPPNWTNLQVVSESDMDTYVTANTQHLYDIIHGVVNEALTILGDTTFRDDGALTVYLQRNSTDNSPAVQSFRKSRGTNGSASIVSAGDIAGAIEFRGYDGAAYQPLAQISVDVDGTPGANDMPGLIHFYTTPDTSVTLTERMRINAAGQVLISNGSISAPALSGLNDTNTGIVFDTGDALGISVGNNRAATAWLDTSESSRIKFIADKNLCVNQTSSFALGGGNGVLSIGNATTVPTGAATGGGILYCEAGALKFRGSSGTLTTIANA
jgi:hypothetical protein